MRKPAWHRGDPSLHPAAPGPVRPGEGASRMGPSLTIIRAREQDLQLAGIAAAAVCGAGLTQPFPDGSPSRGDVADGGSIEAQCGPAMAPRVRAGFVAAGFDTLERAADPVIPPKTKIVTIAVGP